VKRGCGGKRGVSCGLTWRLRMFRDDEPLAQLAFY
jgi:hypothetical protein